MTPYWAARGMHQVWPQTKFSVNFSLNKKRYLDYINRTVKVAFASQRAPYWWGQRRYRYTELLWLYQVHASKCSICGVKMPFNAFGFARPRRGKVWTTRRCSWSRWGKKIPQERSATFSALLKGEGKALQWGLRAKKKSMRICKSTANKYGHKAWIQ